MAFAGARRRLSAWPALVALAIQLAASFGHMHREDFVHGRPGLTIVTQGAGAGAPIDGDDDHLTCDICATVHLAGTLLLPAPPAIALPADITIGRLTAGEQAATLRIPAPPFHARGPPTA